MVMLRQSPLVSLSVIASFLLVIHLVASQGIYNPYAYNTNNYFAASLYSGMWWMQPRCHWGITGHRINNVYQCNTFSCTTLWYGATQYMCPPGTLFSNSLQKCVRPAQLANFSC